MTRPINPNPARRPGDLRAALVEAGLALLAIDGLSGLTLRACAARAGVSHAAPAHHFAGLPGLLTAIAARGFAIFAETMIQDRDMAPQNPRACLIGICQGYLRFARDHPDLFTLMFNHPFQHTDDADFLSHSATSFAVLAQACAPFKPVSDAPGSTEMMVWSQVHGLACLRQSGRMGPPELKITEIDIVDILPDLALKDQTVA